MQHVWCKVFQTLLLFSPKLVIRVKGIHSEGISSPMKASKWLWSVFLGDILHFCMSLSTLEYVLDYQVPYIHLLWDLCGRGEGCWYFHWHFEMSKKNTLLLFLTTAQCQLTLLYFYKQSLYLHAFALLCQALLSKATGNWILDFGATSNSKLLLANGFFVWLIK